MTVDDRAAEDYGVKVGATWVCCATTVLRNLINILRRQMDYALAAPMLQQTDCQTRQYQNVIGIGPSHPPYVATICIGTTIRRGSIPRLRRASAAASSTVNSDDGTVFWRSLSRTFGHRWHRIADSSVRPLEACWIRNILERCPPA
jgi:hypothetical protein